MFTPSGQYDDGQERITPHAPKTLIVGGGPAPADRVLSASSLWLALLPCVLIAEDLVVPCGGAELQANAGATLSADKEIKALVVTGINPESGAGFQRVAVVGAEADHGEAEYPSLETVEAAIAGYAFKAWAIEGGATFQRDTTTAQVRLQSLDVFHRAYGVRTTDKAPPGDVGTDSLGWNVMKQPPRYLETYAHSMAAAGIADGTVLEVDLPPVHGRVRGWRVVCEDEITTGAKTTDLQLAIDGTDVDGAALTYAGTKAAGNVAAGGAPSGDGTEQFRPGAKLQIVAASTTPFTEGRVRIEVVIDRLGA